MKLAILGLISSLIILGIVTAGVIFTGSPGACRDQIVTSSQEENRALLNKINLFMAGELSSLAISDVAVTNLVRSKLDESVEELMICFSPKGWVVSGVARNNSGWPVAFLVSGDLDLSANYPSVSNIEVKLGRLGTIQVVSAYAEKKLNQRLKTIYLGFPMSVSWQEGEVNLSRR